MARVPVPLDFYALCSDELDYELEIRAAPHLILSLQDKCRLMGEQWGTQVVTHRLEALDVTDELRAVRMKTAELEVLALENCGVQRFSKRLNALFFHLYYRTRRIMFRGETDEFLKIAKRINRVQTACAAAYPMYEYPILVLPDDDLDARFSHLSLHESRSTGSKHTSHSSSKKKSKKKKGKKTKKKSRRRSSSASSSTSTSSSSSASSDDRRQSRSQKVREVSRLPYHYGGKKEEDLHEFLTKCDNAAEMYGYSSKDLLGGMGALLQGNALTWFTARKHELTTWSEFKKELKEAFNPAGNDNEIWEKIENLRQSSDETYAVYEARAEELFMRLSEAPTDREKLRKLLNGLHYYYRSRLKSQDMVSLSVLRRECKAHEPDKMHLMRLEKREQRKKEKEKEKDKKKRTPDSFPAVYAAKKSTSSSSSSEDESALASSTPEAKTKNPLHTPGLLPCWRCGRTGHLGANCTNSIRCTVCGMPDVLATSCPNCRRAAELGNWSVASGNLAGAWMGPSQSSFQRPAPYWTQFPPPATFRNPAPHLDPRFAQAYPGGRIPRNPRPQ
ncbi:uncharacterized protein LOC113213829 [Frankliniella occidentalis]|uniref:Zinc finger CCHC domain-containing protein 7 n=1 Tax=Frankliniella occidentalis TaxID=133901 RepID=A0A6J1TAW8_FRAOC|nr:uncharacterized protein LOC113213829 [Frankliniella occidentalis]